jgi:hypothetical protein
LHASDPGCTVAPEQVGGSGVSALSDLDCLSNSVEYRALAFTLDVSFRP